MAMTARARKAKMFWACIFGREVSGKLAGFCEVFGDGLLLEYFEGGTEGCLMWLGVVNGWG